MYATPLRWVVIAERRVFRESGFKGCHTLDLYTCVFVFGTTNSWITAPVADLRMIMLMFCPAFPAAADGRK